MESTITYVKLYFTTWFKAINASKIDTLTVDLDPLDSRLWWNMASWNHLAVHSCGQNHHHGTCKSHIDLWIMHLTFYKLPCSWITVIMLFLYFCSCNECSWSKIIHYQRRNQITSISVGMWTFSVDQHGLDFTWYISSIKISVELCL